MRQDCLNVYLWWTAGLSSFEWLSFIGETKIFSNGNLKNALWSRFKIVMDDSQIIEITSRVGENWKRANYSLWEFAFHFTQDFSMFIKHEVLLNSLFSMWKTRPRLMNSQFGQAARNRLWISRWTRWRYQQQQRQTQGRKLNFYGSENVATWEIASLNFEKKVRFHSMFIASAIVEIRWNLKSTTSWRWNLRTNRIHWISS